MYSPYLIVIAITMNIVSATEQDSDFKGTLIYKCCPNGTYVGRKKSCVIYNNTLSFALVKVYDDDMSYTGKSVLDTFTLVPNKFENETFYELALDSTVLDFNTYLIENGILQLEEPNVYHRWRLIEPRHYCIDYRITRDPSKIGPRFWVLLPDEATTPSSIYYTIGTAISCLFLFLVLIVYLLLPQLQNLSGMILMAYVTSLFMGYLLLAIMQIKIHTTFICIALTCGIYFFILSALCWLCVMAYDIWWTYRGYKKAGFKFLMYCLYACGLPLVMTVGLAVLNTMSDTMKHLPWFITPHVPDFGCFLAGGQKLVYMYVPMLILILCNWIFYLMNVFIVWHQSCDTRVLNSHGQRVSEHFKLSLVITINCVLEVASFMYPGFKMWYVTDAYNSLIGLAIFLIFICKRDIFKALRLRYSNILPKSDDTAAFELKIDERSQINLTMPSSELNKQIFSSEKTEQLPLITSD